MSGLVLPGIGQIAQKNYIRGWSLIFTIFASMAVIVIKTTLQGIAILKKIESEGKEIDIITIMDVASQTSVTSGNLIINLCLLLTFLCWIIGVVDAYITGKKM